MTVGGRGLSADRLMADLAALARIGAAAGGGIDRTAYSPAYRQAADWLKDRMTAAGLRVREDAAGNVIGRIGPDGPALVCGSHIDTVPRGGAYDGALGVLAGLECARTLKAEESRLGRAFEVVAFADEEGAYLSLLGARAMTGQVAAAEIADAAGRGGARLSDALAGYGLDPARVADAARPRGDFAGYIELHIEQGPILEQEKTEIGIVTSTFGIRAHALTLTGAARHAGTTPLDRRRDPLRAAAEAIAESFDAISAEGLADARLTFGDLDVSPGASNVVPGAVRVVREIRAADAATIGRIEAMTARLFENRARRHGVALESVLSGDDAPVALGPVMAGRIEEACRAGARSYRRMISGAGHDAQAFAPVCDTGMIFVPSRDGISHHPDEYTAPDQIGIGLDVLYRTCCALLRPQG